MNDIINNQLELFNGIQSRDELKLVIGSKEAISLIENFKGFMDELSNGGRLFKYNIINQTNDIDKVEVSIACIFDTNYIYMVCSNLDYEINCNSIMLEQLKENNDLSSVVQSLFDKKIDDLTKRNEELIKQQKIVKMQLFNAIDKRNKIIKEITNYINNSINDSIITHISATSEIEKAFIDVNTLLN